jgi:hypothetical protein
MDRRKAPSMMNKNSSSSSDSVSSSKKGSTKKSKENSKEKSKEKANSFHQSWESWVQDSPPTDMMSSVSASFGGLGKQQTTLSASSDLSSQSYVEISEETVSQMARDTIAEDEEEEELRMCFRGKYFPASASNKIFFSLRV